MPILTDVELRDILPIKLDLSNVGVIESLKQRDDCAFTGSTWAHNRDELARQYFERHMLEHRLLESGRISKAHVAEPDLILVILLADIICLI